MYTHMKRESVAVMAIAVVLFTSYLVYQQTLDMRWAVGVGGLMAVSFLHAHLAQLARDQSARVTGRRA